MIKYNLADVKHWDKFWVLFHFILLYVCFELQADWKENFEELTDCVIIDAGFKEWNFYYFYDISPCSHSGRYFTYTLDLKEKIFEGMKTQSAITCS